MTDISDEKQYERLSEDWRQIHNVIWQIPSVALSIITGVVFVAYNLDGWIRVLALGLGSIFLFSMTVEIVKKRLTMDAVASRMQRIELKHISDMMVEPFPTRTTELLKEYYKLNNQLKVTRQKLIGEKKDVSWLKIYEEPEAHSDPPFILFKLSNARACLTCVLFTAAILVSIATYVEFINYVESTKYKDLVLWFYWVGLIPVVIFSILFALVWIKNNNRFKEEIKLVENKA